MDITRSMANFVLSLTNLLVVNMISAVYIGTLQSFSNVSQQKYRSEVKRLVDELVASQNEMNLLRSRMEALKYVHRMP